MRECTFMYNFGAGQKKLWSYTSIISGQGRKSLGAHAPWAPPSLAPLYIIIAFCD